jgi:hypothetical protein
VSSGNNNLGRPNTGNGGFGTFGRLWGLIVRRNSGPELAGRRRLDLVEGPGVTLGVADDPAQNEVKVTVSATGPSLGQVMAVTSFRG